MSRRRIGLMGGTYNPVHIGHLMVADYARQHCRFDEVWMVVSPLNPLKAERGDIVDDCHRLEMLRLACSGSEGLRPCDVELSMPLPSYTIDTLRHLSELYPDTDFSIIIGADNWLLFDRWRSADEIIRDFGVTVYPRPGYDIDQSDLPENVSCVDAPTVNISSTWIRREIAEGFDVNIFLPHGVYNYILQNRLYK